MAGGSRFLNITRKDSVNLGYCHLSQVRIASFKNRTLYPLEVFEICDPVTSAVSVLLSPFSLSQRKWTETLARSEVQLPANRY